MLETIAVILVVLWVLGLVSSYTMGGAHSYPSGHCGCGDSGSRDSRSTPVTPPELM